MGDRPVYLTPENLKRWIPELKAEGRMYAFYKTPEWIALRDSVLEAAHYECEDCKRKTPSKITRAVTVHHEKPIDIYPELALSRTYIDEHGQPHAQLHALCADCHNARHHRFGHNDETQKEKPLTPERW